MYGPVPTSSIPVGATRRASGPSRWSGRRAASQRSVSPASESKPVSKSILGTFHPRHVVLATGHSGEPNLPDIKGIDDFQGDRVVHSSQFNGPESNAKGKKAVVVGCCNSGHDIARDYYEHGYDVTMVQRSSTLVLTCESLLEVTMKGLYAEDGVRVFYPLILNSFRCNLLWKWKAG